MNTLRKLKIWYWAHFYKFRQNPNNKLLVFILDWLFVPVLVSFKTLIDPNTTLNVKIFIFCITLFFWWWPMKYFLQKRMKEKTKYYYDLYNKDLVKN